MASRGDERNKDKGVVGHLGVHLKYREFGAIAMVCVLGLLMAFIAYGRLVLRPIV